MCASKKGVSSNQLHRTLGCTLKTVWFVSHRLREAMRAGDLAAPFGSNGGAVEADETFIWRKEGIPKRAGYEHKMTVLTLIDRDRRTARSTVLENVRPHTIAPILRENLSREARLMTDEAGHYLHVGKEFAEHGVVRHSSKEYVKGDAYTNTAEGYFSIFKRGMKGIYQHCHERHLHRYLAEFDFRYNNRQATGVSDLGRTAATMLGAKGKRLLYRDSFAR